MEDSIAASLGTTASPEGPPTLKRRRDPQERAAELVGAVFFTAYALVLLLHRPAPSLTDYANWVYQGVLLHDHLLGLADTAHRLKSYPVPNSAATLGVGLLCFLLPWKWAAEVWLCAQLLISWLTTRHMLRTLSPQGGALWLWLIVPVATYLNVNFWYGFVNFQLGLCWVVLMASLLLRRARATSKQAADWPLGLLLVVCFLTHMIPFAFCGLLLLLYARQTRRWRAVWQLVPAAALSVWYVVGRFLLERDADGQAGMQATVRTYSAAFWAYKANSYIKSFGFVNPQTQDAALFSQSGFLLLFAINAALCLLLGWAMVQAARVAFREQANERFLWTAILLVLPLYLIAPGAALGVSDPGSRLLQTALALGVLLAARTGWTLRGASACATALGLAGLILFVREGFAPTKIAPSATKLPRAVADFNHVPNDDQDYFYGDLERAYRSEKVFPTGMFLNVKSKHLERQNAQNP